MKVISMYVSSLLFIVLSISTHCCAQSLGPDFASDYSIVDLGIPKGVPTTLGGLTFLDNDTLLIGGAANQTDADIYRVSVTRDPVGNYINGFSGPATLYASAPSISGGLAFGPGGVLFYTTYPTHLVGQIKPGSASTNKITGLGTNVASSTGTLQFVPSGFAGAGQLKIASYNSSDWHTVGLTPDGNGTFNLTSFSSSIALEGGTEGIVYVKNGNPGFCSGFDSIKPI